LSAIFFSRTGKTFWGISDDGRKKNKGMDDAGNREGKRPEEQKGSVKSLFIAHPERPVVQAVDALQG